VPALVASEPIQYFAMPAVAPEGVAMSASVFVVDAAVEIGPEFRR